MEWTACSQSGLLLLTPAVSEPWPRLGLAHGLSFSTQPPWCWLALFLCYSHCPEFCPTPSLDPATAIWAAVSAHSTPPPSILLLLHCFAWITSCGPEVSISSCFLGYSHAHLEIVLYGRIQVELFCSLLPGKRGCLLLSFCRLTTQPI